MITHRITQIVSATCATVVLSTVGVRAQNWEENTITPVTNPIFFESPLIQSEIHPVFAWHRLDKSFLGANVDVRLYAAQIRYAVNDRLAIIATKDGFIEMDPGPDGWADIGAGMKYALYRNDDQQIVVTPGFTFEFPTGNRRVFQGNGDGEFNLFVSAIKGWDKFHFTANIGGRIPVDQDAETANIRYCGMVDYYACRWFIPFATMNAYTTLSEGKATAFKSEGFDLINFGSSGASGETQAAWGVGFRSRLHKNVDFGFAYEQGFTPGNDIFKDRFTMDFVFRF